MRSVSLFLVMVCCFCGHGSKAQIVRTANASAMPASSSQSSSYSYSNSSSNSNYTPAQTSYSNNSPASQSHSDISYRYNYSATDARTASTTEYSYSPSPGTAVSASFSGATGPSGAAGHSSSASARGGMRYNYSAHRYYPYYTSYNTTSRSRRHYCDSVRIYCPPHIRPVERYGRIQLPPVVEDVLFYEYIADYVATIAEPVSTYNGVFNFSLDGYVVYNNDTLTGVVTMNQNSVYVEKEHDKNSETAYKVRTNDKDLKSVTLFKGNKSLVLTRLADNEPQLWRVVHNGKLMVYDDNCNFLSADNIDREKMRVKLPGETTYVDIDSKRHLVWCLNRAYGLDLKVKDQTWPSLITLIDKLDR